MAASEYTSLWTLADLARAYLLTGFPWGLVAYAWVETPVIQAVALFGPHTLGLLTLVAALLPGLRTWPALAAAFLHVTLGGHLHGQAQLIVVERF